MTRDSSGSIVAYGKLAGLPSVHFVMAWNSVDLPTFARPTYSTRLVSSERSVCQGALLTIPLFKLLPGRPRGIFSSLTAFLGGMPLRFA